MTTPGLTMDPDAVPSSTRRLGGHFAALLLGAVVTRVVSLASQIVLARLLGPSALGSVAVAQALVLVSNILTDGGLTVLALREVIRSPEQRPAIASATVALQTGFAGACVGLLCLAGLALPWDGDTGELIAVFSPSLLFAALGLGYLLQAAERMGTLAVGRVLAAAVPAVTAVFLVSIDRNPIWIAVANCVGFLIADLYIYRRLRRDTGLRMVRPEGRTVRRLARQGRPFLATSLLLIVPAVAGTISLGALRSAHEVGLFNAVWQLCFAATSVSALLADAVYPDMVRRWANHSLGAFVSVIAGLALRATLVGAVFTAFSAAELVNLLFGAQYADAGPILALTVWTVPLGFTWVLIGQGVNAANAQRAIVGPNAVIAMIVAVGCAAAARLSGVLAVVAVLLCGYVIQVGAYTAIATRRAILTQPLLVLKEAPYAILPAALCLGVHAVAGENSVPLDLVACVLGGVLAELAMRRPTLRLLRGGVPSTYSARHAQRKEVF